MRRVPGSARLTVNFSTAYLVPFRPKHFMKMEGVVLVLRHLEQNLPRPDGQRAAAPVHPEEHTSSAVGGPLNSSFA